MDLKNLTSVYTLTKTKLSSGKFHYVVTDANGSIISQRKSNREYVACVADGSYYFGRLDLINNGSHARELNSCIAKAKWTKSDFDSCSYLMQFYTYEQFIDNSKNRVIELNTIAYIK